MDLNAKRQALLLLSNGVYILTSRSRDRYGGATVTWASQASFKPPLMMVAIRPSSNVFHCMSESGVAVLHVVSTDQTHIAQRFFAPTTVVNGRLNDEPFTSGKTGAPVLASALAYVECRVRQCVQTGGDHAVAILEVVEASACKGIQPLTVDDSPWQYGG
jgi:flavin reductase (DIM6/NTAB) family NADH-FMN oxidoreductase RutF